MGPVLVWALNIGAHGKHRWEIALTCYSMKK